MQNISGYTRRKFACDLGFQPQWLEEVFRGKRGISQIKASLIVQKLDLNSREKRIFIASVQFLHGRSQEIRGWALMYLQKEYRLIQQKDWFVMEDVRRQILHGFGENKSLMDQYNGRKVFRVCHRNKYRDKTHQTIPS